MLFSKKTTPDPFPLLPRPDCKDLDFPLLLRCLGKSRPKSGGCSGPRRSGRRGAHRQLERLRSPGGAARAAHQRPSDSPAPSVGVRVAAGSPCQCSGSPDASLLRNLAKLAVGSRSPWRADLDAAPVAHCAPPYSGWNQGRRSWQLGREGCDRSPKELFWGFVGSNGGVARCCCLPKQCNPRVEVRTCLPPRLHSATLLLSLLAWS